MRQIIFMLTIGIVLVSCVNATDIYVSNDSIREVAPCDIGNPCTLNYANQNAEAGDTVYIRGGTYEISSGAAISPVDSGLEGNPITYSNYNGEIVQFTATGTASAVSITNGQNYIKVTGLKFDKFRLHLNIGSSPTGLKVKKVV